MNDAFQFSSVTLYVSFAIAGFIAFLFYLFGFWRPLVKPLFPLTLSFREVLVAFFIFFLTPPLFSIIFTLALKHILHSDFRIWLLILVTTFSAICFLWFLFSRPKAVRESIFRRGKKSRWKSWILGCLSWLLVYPLVMSLGSLIVWVMEQFITFTTVDQLPVGELKKTLSNPFLFWSYVMIIVALVPCLEESLFRGFFQTYLVRKMGQRVAILGSALLFASFHLSPSQGWMNLQFFLVLFILGCFLGYLYEREQTLWASIGLHMTFNAMTVIMVSTS